MTESEWLQSSSPLYMLGFLRVGRGRAKLRALMSREACLRKLLWFAVAAVRRISEFLPDDRSRKAVDAVERIADGLISFESAADVRMNAEAAYDTWRRGTDRVGYTAAYAALELIRVDGRYAFSHAIFVAFNAALAREFQFSNDEAGARLAEETAQATLLREVFGNPFRPDAFRVPAMPSAVIEAASRIYDHERFDEMPRLAGMLAGSECGHPDLLDHCRSGGPHVRGCWALDAILGKVRAAGC